MQGYCMRFFSGREARHGSVGKPGQLRTPGVYSGKVQSAPDAQRDSPAALQLGGRLHRGQRGGGAGPGGGGLHHLHGQFLCAGHHRLYPGPVHSVCPEIRRQGAGGHPPDSLHLSLGVGRNLPDPGRPGYLLCGGASAPAPHHPGGAPPGHGLPGHRPGRRALSGGLQRVLRRPPGDWGQPGSLLRRSPLLGGECGVGRAVCGRLGLGRGRGGHCHRDRPGGHDCVSDRLRYHKVSHSPLPARAAVL